VSSATMYSALKNQKVVKLLCSLPGLHGIARISQHCTCTKEISKETTCAEEGFVHHQLVALSCTGIDLVQGMRRNKQ